VFAADRVGKPAIVLVPANSPQAQFEVSGLTSDISIGLRKLSPRDPRWPQIFKIFVVATAGDQPSMLGSYEPTSDGVRFRPRFPLERGIAYRAVFNWPHRESSATVRASGSTVHLDKTYMLPVSPAGPQARVVAIYPSADELPENLLRIYVQFSASMSQGNSYRHLHLRDETAGTEVEQPFLELPQELWSPDGTRLTLLLEPGRVKHGLVPREDLGPILVSGRNYSFTVDANWPDAEGRPLETGRRKIFRAGKSISEPVDPRSWVVHAPQAGTRQPLTVRFPKPLDHGMLERVLRVVPSGGLDASAGTKELQGTTVVSDEETRWAFEPREPWSKGRYALAVSKRLEDPAGNSIGQPFEVDLKRLPNRTATPPVIRLDFDVRERP
jgi:hypothetical protein